MLRPEWDFGRRPAAPAPQPVDDPAARDREQPGPEGATRIVGVADGVHRQEHVLHDVLDLADQQGVPGYQGAEIGGHVLEQPPVGDPVASLRARHQLGPGQ